MALSVTGANSFRVGHPSRGASVVMSYPQADSNASKIGAPQVFSSGLLAEGGADPTNIVGIAQEDGDNDTGNNKNMMVALALPTTIFQGHISDDITGDYTTVAANLGSVYAIAKDATNLGWYVDANDTAVANVRVRIVGFRDPVGTVNGRVYFTFLTATQDTDDQILLTPTIWSYASAT